MKSEYPTFGKFRDNFEVSDSMLAELTANAATRGVEMVEEEFLRSKSFMKRQFKALIARNLFTDSAYYEVLNSEGDSVMDEGVRIVTNWDKIGKKILGY